MPMMFSGVPADASTQEANAFSEGSSMIADLGYDVPAAGLESVLGIPVTVGTQDATAALSKRMQDCAELGLLIEQLDPPPQVNGDS